MDGKFRKYKYIMIFGAKRDAEILYTQIKYCLKDIVCFVVSEKRDNPNYLAGKQVKTFNETSFVLKETGLIVISQKYENNDRMKLILSEAGFRHIIASPLQSMWSIGNLKNEYSSILGTQRIGVEEFCEQSKVCTKKNVRIQIYAVTSHGNLHNANRYYVSKYVKYIQAGAAMVKKRICDITDDTGDNISKLNLYFCELTAGYWIYKNDKENEYVGLYHYSRGLAITDEQIEKIVNSGIDVVLPVPHIFRHEMANAGTPQEIKVILEAITRVSPEYMDSARRYFMGKVFMAGNIIFARKEVYCKYYEWLFRILDESVKIKKEQRIKPSERLFGYYGETLMNIFFIYNISQYNTLYSEVIGMF